MRTLTKTVTSLAMMGGVLLGAKSAFASGGSLSFSATNTASATQNTVNVSFAVASGQPIKISTNGSGTCAFGGSTGTGDTYIRLYDPSGAQVATSDDSCSTLQSYISYTAAATGNYTLKIGCYSSGSCSGTAVYSAGNSGVVFVHGTGDNLGAQSCTGTGNDWRCVVQSAVDGYWGQAEIDSVRTRADGTKRPYAVTGHHGGSWKPWANASPIKGSGTESATADEIAAQIEAFIKGPDGVYGTLDDITDIVIVTHSGGSNQIRFILQQAAASTARLRVKTATKKVVTIAGPQLGTYLANQVFTNGSLFDTINGVIQFFGGSGLYNDDGTYFIQTGQMSTQNQDAAKFVSMDGLQAGVPFRQTGGTSDTTCIGFMAWGVCVGVWTPTLGSSTCDSLTNHLGLTALHALYLNANDSSTARSKCSDGFITCDSAKALGAGSSTYTFGFGLNQDHNQSRKTCNGLDSKIRAEVNGVSMAYDDNLPLSSFDVSPQQWDACGFLSSTVIGDGTYTRYTRGCSPDLLGDGKCDADCVAVYGHDSTPTWTGSNAACSADSGCGSSEKCVSGKCVKGSGADCSSAANSKKRCFGAGEVCVPSTTGASYRCVSGVASAWSASDDCAQYGPSSTETNYAFDPRTFNGKTKNGDSTVWFTAPGSGTSYCPQSWIGDGMCDECVLAIYGSDGNDCMPGHVQACDGLNSHVAANYSTSTNNVLCNGYDSTSTSTGAATSCSSFMGWSLRSNLCNSNADCPSGSTCTSGKCSTNVGNGRCDVEECKPALGTVCSTSADCVGPGHETWATCVSGRCNDASSKCASSADCTGGATCSNGACTTAPADCNFVNAAGVAGSLCQ